jgi:hypothetical protein
MESNVPQVARSIEIIRKAPIPVRLQIKPTQTRSRLVQVSLSIRVHQPSLLWLQYPADASTWPVKHNVVHHAQPVVVVCI